MLELLVVLSKAHPKATAKDRHDRLSG
jgi:hypothetical protein